MPTAGLLRQNSLPPGTIFVAPSGSDSNPGTQALPYATINKAASVVTFGDIVIVENGTWQDTHSALGTPSIVEVGRGGTAASPVTFRARNYLGAKLDGQNGTANQGFNFRNNVGYVDIYGFEIFGMASTTGSCAGVDTFSGGHDSRIILCSIHDCGRICIAHGFGQNGIYAGADNLIIERCSIYSIGRLGPTEGCGTPGPYQSNDHGIYHASGNSLTIRNNLFYNNTHGWSIQEYPSERTGTRILNNTFAFGNQYFNFTHIVLDSTFHNSLIANNIFYDTSASKMIKVTSFAGALTLQKNLASATATTDSDPVAGITYTSNITNTNALLVNPPLDMSLQAGSPALDVGVTLSDVTRDFNNNGRPSNVTFDIGAYEK